jgi:hypothetical protein
MADNTKHKLLLRHLCMADYKNLHEISARVYREVANVVWPEHLMRRLVETFPEGQLLSCLHAHGRHRHFTLLFLVPLISSSKQLLQ